MSNALMELADVNTSALMPAVLSEDSNVGALMAAADGYWREIAPAIALLGVLATIDSQPAEVLELLAHQFHVDYWRDDWDLTKKRRIIKDTIRLHRIAGTRGAVDDIIESVWGDGAIVREWWEYGGEPGTFDVILVGDQTQEAVEAFVASIRKVKRATDHLTISVVNDVGALQLYMGAVYHQWDYYRL